MGSKYVLGKTPSGKYPELKCADESDAFVRSLSIQSSDCIGFRREEGSLRHFWSLHDLMAFEELRGYMRLIYMPEQDIEKLAGRVYQHCFDKVPDDLEKQKREPVVDKTRPEYRKILEEIAELQREERRLVDSGVIDFSKLPLSTPDDFEHRR